MSTEVMSLHPPRSISWRAMAFSIFLPMLLLALGTGFWLVSGILYFVSYTLFFAVVELVLGAIVWKKFSPIQGRWRLLLLLLFGFVWAVVGGSIFQTQATPAVRNGSLLNLLSSPELFFSIWGGGLVALVGVTMLTLLFLGLVANSLRQWQNAEDISYREVFRYVYRSYLRPRSWYLSVEDGDLVGTEPNKNLFKKFGGPGWLFIFPDHMIVFHKQGKITRTTGDGWVELEAGERIRAILPLGAQRHVFKIERLLTRDRIYLNLEMNYVVEIEKASDTFKRLKADREEARDEYVRCQQAGASAAEIREASDKYREASQALSELGRDKILGEGDDSYYESVIKNVAGKASNVKEALKTPIEMYLRDIMMTQNSDEMVFIKGGTGQSLAESIEQRRLQEIEKMIQDKIAEDALKRGLVLKKFDMTNVEYPQEVNKKITEEVGSVIKSRIQRREADDMVYESEQEAKVKLNEAEAELDAAEYIVEAQRRVMEGDMRNYLALIRVLQRLGLSEGTIREVLSNLTSTDALGVRIRQTQRQVRDDGGDNGDD